MKRVLILTAALVTLFAAMRVSGQSRIVEMGITSTEMASYFQQHAGSQDIARVDHPNDVGLISGLTVGKKMAIFKTASQIQQFLASSASSIDIVGYNLEPGQANDANELANPVAAAQTVRAVATQYGKLVAIGLTHDLTLQYGAAMAPYADIWVLQIQKAQNDPQMASEFVNQMVPALMRANPAIKVFVQIRTDSQPAALASLVNSFSGVHVSILTQKSDVQDAINVAGVFFGQGGSQAPANFQPVAMAGGSQYGIRVPSKVQGWFAPVASNLIGSNERDHLGRGSINAWDWSASVGSPVFAIGPGTIRYAGCNDAGHYGCWASISHGNGLQSDYAHCLENSIRVQDGQPVDASTQLCSIGRTGWTSWPHVHLAIKLNGTPQPISNYFDTSLVVYCHFSNCQATNDPNAPIAGMGMQTASQQTSQPARLWYAPFVDALAAMEPSERVAISFAIPIGIALLLWLTTGTLRVIVISVLASVIATVTVLVILAPALSGGQAQQTSQPVSQQGSWDAAYAFMRKWEGGPNPPCVHDPIRTLKGITNITYNAWRQSKGLGPGDVCSDLTDEQAKQIYYERYWLASGADKLPTAVAIQHFDHAVNAGVGAANGILAKCGNDVECYINGRFADYRTKKNCPEFCKAWFNRVNDSINYLRTLATVAGAIN